MNVVETFGRIVGDKSRENPEQARKVLLTGYRLQNMKNRMLPDKRLPASGQYVAEVVMRNMIQALAHPENAAMVSIFVPGELLTAAGMSPYSVEAISCFLSASHCEQAMLAKTDAEGFPETMCSYHRIFLGSSLSGLMPKPKCTVYTNLACDGNMMTFPYLKQKQELPGFYIDVPYEKNGDSVEYVADQLRELKCFLEDVFGRKITEEAVLHAVANSQKAAENYERQLALRRDHDPITTVTNELYAIFMCHLLAGREESLKYTELLLRDVEEAPAREGLKIIWMHIMPFLQEPVTDVFNFDGQALIKACDFTYDAFRTVRSEDPYEVMAEKMVYSLYNGSVQSRIDKAVEVARQTGADGAILFAHWGCKSTIGASGLIKKGLEEAGIPTIVLDGDGCNPANTSDGQVSTRLQAFLEMLRKEEAHDSLCV